MPVIGYNLTDAGSSLQFLASDDATNIGNSRGATRNVWIISSIGKNYIKS